MLKELECSVGGGNDAQSRQNCGIGSSEHKTTTLTFGNATTNDGTLLSQSSSPSTDSSSSSSTSCNKHTVLSGTGSNSSSSSPSRDNSNNRTTGKAAKTTLQGIHGNTRKTRNGVSLTTNTGAAHGCFDYLTIRSSNRIGEPKITCSGCKREFLVPTSTSTYRCCECQGVSNSISSRENNGGAKPLKQDQQDSPNTNRGSSSLSRTTITGNKRAVLCGVTYSKRQFKLSGTINDVINMKDLLVNKFQFPKDSIKVLTEEEKDPNFIPTKRNIMESLKWLVRDCQSGDSLVFYFSGHGLQQPAEHHKEDEIDGLDETICPVDFMIEGMISDNEINSTIVRPLKKGVKLHAIIDACHSGTILDLMYVYKKDNGNWKWMVNKAPTSKESVTKSTSGGVAICLSACEDSQMAADTAAFGGKEVNGVMTYLLTKTIREHSVITYADLLEKVHEEIGKIHRRKYGNGIEQDPLLSSSEKFDVYTRISF